MELTQLANVGDLIGGAAVGDETFIDLLPQA